MDCPRTEKKAWESRRILLDTIDEDTPMSYGTPSRCRYDSKITVRKKRNVNVPPSGAFADDEAPPEPTAAAEAPSPGIDAAEAQLEAGADIDVPLEAGAAAGAALAASSAAGDALVEACAAAEAPLAAGSSAAGEPSPWSSVARAIQRFFRGGMFFSSCCCNDGRPSEVRLWVSIITTLKPVFASNFVRQTTINIIIQWRLYPRAGSC